MTSFVEFSSYNEDKIKNLETDFGTIREAIYNHIKSYIEREKSNEKKKLYRWFGFYSSAIKKERVSEARQLKIIVTTSLDADLFSSIEQVICSAHRGVFNRSSLLDTIARYIQNLYTIENKNLKGELKRLHEDLSTLQVAFETVSVENKGLKDEIENLRLEHRGLLEVMLARLKNSTNGECPNQ